MPTGRTVRGAPMRSQRKRSPMPVDHPASLPGAVRRAHGRKLTVALSFLLTLGALLAVAPFFDLGQLLS